jgi:hypothetical protein
MGNAGRHLLVAAATAVIAASVCASAVDVQVGPIANAPAEIQTLVRQAIEDRIRAGDVPDLDLRFGRNRNLHIRREISRANLLLADDALPHVEGFTFSILTKAELQAESDRLNQSSMFIIVNAAGIQNDTATVELGTDILLPTTSKAGKLCCCIGAGSFKRAVLGWTLDHWGSIVCS